MATWLAHGSSSSGFLARSNSVAVSRQCRQLLLIAAAFGVSGLTSTDSSGTRLPLGQGEFGDRTAFPVPEWAPGHHESQWPPARHCGPLDTGEDGSLTLRR